MQAWVGPLDEPRRYVLDDGIDPVAGGGEGFVYRARRVADDRRVAVKQLVSVPPAEWSRQVDRIRIVGTVDHPNLGRHLEAFVGPYPFADEVPEDDEFEILYTVMAWVEGRDLSEAVHGADLRRVFGWVRDVSHATGALHRHPTPTGLGIVHRDVKPSNVRVAGEGHAVLVDFGIARPMDGTTMTRTAGAPGWMPPEAFASPDRVGARSDNWQVGGLAAWALLDTAPGSLVPEDRRRRLENALRERLPGAPARPLARHIDRALASRPGERPRDIDRWGDRLVTLAEHRTHRMRTTVMGVAAAVVVLGAAVAIWSGTRAGDDRAETPEPPAIGTVTVEGGAWAPANYGEPVMLTVDRTTAAAPPATGAPSTQLVVQPMTGNEPTPGVVTSAVALAEHRQSLTFTVNPPADRGRTTFVDRLLVRALSPSSETTITQDVPVRLTFAEPLEQPETCVPYDPAAVQIDDSRPTAVRVVAGPTELATMSSRPEAEQVAELAAQADEECFIGTAEGSQPRVQYWKRDGRLLGQLPPPRMLVNADCRTYAPDSLRTNDKGSLLVGERESLVQLPDPVQLAQALRLARHYHRHCVIARYSGESTDVDHPIVNYWQ